MSRPIPALDPLGKRAERTGFIRTESIHLPPSGRSGEKEEPGITLWAGPKVIFINAMFPGIDLNDLQISITGTRMVFTGLLRPKPTIGRTGLRSPSTPVNFRHSVELPYRVDADRAEVRKENGLISIILKKEASSGRHGNAHLESSIMNSMRRYFGEYGPPAGTQTDENKILQSLEKYFDYLSKGEDALYRRPQP